MFSFKSLFGKTKKASKRPVPPTGQKFTTKNVRKSDYYLNNGKYYAMEDDSLIEDLILLAVIAELYNTDVVDVDEGAGGTPVSSAAEDIAAIDAAAESVREEYSRPEPVYSAPEPSYSSDSYDSGSSDCGDCD